MKLSSPQDTLSTFLGTAARNSEITLTQWPAITELLEGINGVFLASNEAITKSPDWFFSLFLGRAHSAYLAAVRLATAGEAPETCMVLRGALENALYANFMHADPEGQKFAEVWLNRNHSKKEKDLVINTFKMGNLREALSTRSESIGRNAATLYERLIDLGGHPNRQGHFGSAAWYEEDGEPMFTVFAVTDNVAVRALALKLTVEVGLTILDVFNLIYGKRFELAGLLDRMETIKSRAEVTFRPFSQNHG